MNLRLKISVLLTVLLGHHPMVAKSTKATFPEEPAKQLIQSYCGSCHQLNRISGSSGYTQAQWQQLTATMIDLSASPDQSKVTSYLAKHFPPNEKHRPKLQTGNESISFKEWVVPTLGQRSRDPIQAEDGTIWWAGQWGNLIGRIDAKTGAMKEYPLPPNAMPHSVTLDLQGNVWYTGNKNGTVGRVHPETGEVTEYHMPDPKAKDPHTAIFDRHGIMWMTLQHSNMLGRLDPTSGDIKLVSMPTPGSRPYGIKIDANDNPWVACNGSNCLVKVNPETMALTEYKLPDDKSKVRRLDIASDGMIWYVNSSLGRLGRFNPINGEVKEWPSPSGRHSHPYAIVVVNGIVWYNESGMRPDTLVRFDPETEKFQSWPIPSGEVYAGVVRHMRSTPAGNILMHQSSTNRIILVTPQNEKEQ